MLILSPDGEDTLYSSREVKVPRPNYRLVPGYLPAADVLACVLRDLTFGIVSSLTFTQLKNNSYSENINILNCKSMSYLTISSPPIFVLQIL